MIDGKRFFKNLLILLFLFTAGIIMASSFDSSELDDICDVDDNFLFRLNGYWECWSQNNLNDLINITQIINVVVNDTSDLYVNITGDTMTGELDLPSLDFTGEINIKRNQTSLIYTDLNTNSIRLNFPIPQASFGTSNYIYPNTQYCYQFGRNHYCRSSDSLQSGQSHYGTGTYNAQFGYQNLINSTGSINGVLQAGLTNAYKSGLYGVQAGALNTGGGFSTIQLGFNNLGPTGFFGYYQIGTNNEFGSNSGGSGTLGSGNFINTQGSFVVGQNNHISGFAGGTYGLGTQVYTQGGNDYFLGEYFNITSNKIVAIGFGGDTTKRVQLNESNAIYLVSKETTTSPAVISAKINGTVSKFETNIYTTKNMTVDGFTKINNNLNVSENITGNEYFGTMYQSDLSTTVTVTSTGIYYNITGMSSDYNNGFTFSLSSLTAQKSGLYKFIFHVGMSDGTGNTNFHLTPLINGINSSCVTHLTTQGTNDEVNAGGVCTLRLVQGDLITLGLANMDNTNNANIESAQLDIEWRGH